MNESKINTKINEILKEFNAIEKNILENTEITNKSLKILIKSKNK